MKHLLSLFVLAVTLFTALNAIDASANPRPDNPSFSGGRVTCMATDNGWEEHFGGHSTCQKCLSKHSSCTERCSTENYSCKAEGTDYQGRVETFEAYGSDEYFARDEALDRCYRMGARSCSSSGCTTISQVVSTRSCQ